MHVSVQASTWRNCEWLIKAVFTIYLMVAATWITVVLLELIHASKPDFAEGLCLLGTQPTQVPPGNVSAAHMWSVQSVQTWGQKDEPLCKGLQGSRIAPLIIERALKSRDSLLNLDEFSV